VTAPIDVLGTFVLGGAIALACRVQLRLNPRPWYATRYFAALASLHGLVVLPAAAYRYFFHPDWSAMYLVPASETSGLFGLGALVVVCGAAIGAFVLGNHCAKARKEWVLLTSLAVAIAGIATISSLGSGRISRVGTIAQWEGTFGLRDLVGTDLFVAAVVMGGCALVAWLQVLILFAFEGAAVRSASR
jgi:hypothetical protein